MVKQNGSKKKSSCRRDFLAAGIILLFIIAALVFIWFRQEELKFDLANEKIIREAAATQLRWETQIEKDPNDLTDEDFVQFKEIHLNAIWRVWRQDDMFLLVVPDKELSDFKFFSKFTNLQELDLRCVKYPDKNIPKWMKILAKIGVFDLEERFAIDLSPIRNLYGLKRLHLSSAQISDIKPLKGLINLEVLSIAGTRVSDLEPLRGLTNLQDLSIIDTPVSSLEPLKQLKKLRRLIMINCKNITDEQIKDLKNSLPELIVIEDYPQ